MPLKWIFFYHWIFSKCHTARNELQYRKFLKRSRKQNTVFIHPPKTAGRAIAETLSLNGAGHFNLDRHLKSRTVQVERIVFSYRDPIERIISIFKMSRKPMHKKKTGALYPLNKFATIEDFISSGLLQIYSKNHYFFLPQNSYLDGVLSSNLPTFAICTGNIEQDMQNKLGCRPILKNVSPSIEANKIQLSDKSTEIIKEIYADDYSLINEIIKRGI